MSGIEQCLWLCLSALGPSSVPQNKGVTCASEAGGWQSGGRRPRPCGHPRPRCGHRWPLSTAAHGRTLGRRCSVDPDLLPSRGPRRCRRSGPQPSQRCLRRAKGRGAHRGQGQGHDLTAAGAAGAAAGPGAAGRARLHSWENLLRTRPRHPPSALPGPRWDPHRPVPATRCSRWPAVSSCCCRGCQPRRGTPPAQAAGRTGPGRDAPCLWSSDSEGQGERVGTVSREQYPDSLDTRRVGLSPPEAKGEASASGPGGTPCRAGGAVSAGAPTASDRGVPHMSLREAWLWRQTDRPAPTPAWASASCP